MKRERERKEKVRTVKGIACWGRGERVKGGDKERSGGEGEVGNQTRSGTERKRMRELQMYVSNV